MSACRNLTGSLFRRINWSYCRQLWDETYSDYCVKDNHREVCLREVRPALRACSRSELPDQLRLLALVWQIITLTKVVHLKSRSKLFLSASNVLQKVATEVAANSVSP